LSLIDRGVNDAGDGIDMWTFFKIGSIGDIRGFDTHQCINIGVVGGVIQTHKGSIIRIVQSYTMLTKEPTIHCPYHFEWYKNDVKDKSIIVPGGLQHIQTVVGYPTPLNIKDGLTHLSIDPNTDHKWDNLPNVICTSELEWDPSVLDNDVREDEQWGEVPTPKYFCDEIGDCPVFYDAHETDLGLTPEDTLPGSTPSGPCVLKWWFLGLTCLVLGYILCTLASSMAPELSPNAVPYTARVRVLTSDSEVIIYRSLLHSTTSDDNNFYACMSGGESSINNGILNDRAIINLCKLAGTSNNAGMSSNGTKVDPIPSLIFNSGGKSHIHNGSLKDRSHIESKHVDMLNDDVMPTEISKHPAMPIDSGMITDGIEPLPPPEPPPLIFTPEKLRRCTFLMDKKEDSQKLIGQVIVSQGSQ
jgi:hypothetical protein